MASTEPTGSAAPPNSASSFVRAGRYVLPGSNSTTNATDAAAVAMLPTKAIPINVSGVGAGSGAGAKDNNKRSRSSDLGALAQGHGDLPPPPPLAGFRDVAAEQQQQQQQQQQPPPVLFPGRRPTRRKIDVDESDLAGVHRLPHTGAFRSTASPLPSSATPSSSSTTTAAPAPATTTTTTTPTFIKRPPPSAFVSWRAREVREGWREEMASVERRHAPDRDYMRRQRHVTPYMRAVLLNWMFEVAQEYTLKRETTHYAVHYVDRYMSLVQRPIPKTEYQLVGVTALFLASKMEEIMPPPVTEFAAMTTRNGYTDKQILEREAEMVETLEWKLFPATPYAFASCFLDGMAALVMARGDSFASASATTATTRSGSSPTTTMAASTPPTSPAVSQSTPPTMMMGGMSTPRTPPQPHALSASTSTSTSTSLLTSNPSSAGGRTLMIKSWTGPTVVSELLMNRVMEILDVATLDADSMCFLPSFLVAAVISMLVERDPHSVCTTADVEDVTGIPRVALDDCIEWLTYTLGLDPVRGPHPHVEHIERTLPPQDRSTVQRHNPEAIRLYEARWRASQGERHAACSRHLERVDAILAEHAERKAAQRRKREAASVSSPVEFGLCSSSMDAVSPCTAEDEPELAAIVSGSMGGERRRWADVRAGDGP